MIKLTDKEKDLLKVIMHDKYACGPFVGMCTNITLDQQSRQIETTPESIIQKALQIRIIAEDMTKDTVKQSYPGIKIEKSTMTNQGPLNTKDKDDVEKLKETEENKIKPIDDDLKGL